MKNLILSLIVVSITTLSADAQPTKRGNGKMTPEQIATKQTETMKTNLGLSNEQAVTIETINLEAAKKRQEARENNNSKETMQTIQEDRHTKLESVLTEEQYTKMLALEEEQKQQRSGQGKRRAQ